MGRGGATDQVESLHTGDHLVQDLSLQFGKLKNKELKLVSRPSCATNQLSDLDYINSPSQPEFHTSPSVNKYFLSMY